jgi:hypothetical protein
MNQWRKRRKHLKHGFMHFSDGYGEKYINWIVIPSTFFCEYEIE